MRAIMNLHGSITELQNAIVQLYHDLQTRFIENRMISELWTAMAHDITQQISSLNALPSSVWNRLKNEREGLAETISANSRSRGAEKMHDRSLRTCFEHSLHIEEPLILKAYVPIIRSLRENQANQSLDFYIMVKAHLARISRVTQAFSGDPIVIQRSNLLLQNFEKEVQEPQVPVVLEKKKTHISNAPSRTKPSRTTAKHVSLPSSKRPLSRTGRTKPLVDKVELRHRRAHR
jgi:hypothetical protein